MTPDQRLGAKIKILRKSSGMTQLHVGEILGVNQTAVCRIESGEQKLTAVQLHVLSVGFGVELGEFFEEAE